MGDRVSGMYGDRLEGVECERNECECWCIGVTVVSSQFRVEVVVVEVFLLHGVAVETLELILTLKAIELC